MYYNGYIIISIFIGAYLGFFIFGWEPIELGYVSIKTTPPIMTILTSLRPGYSGPAEEATNCCG